MTGDEYIPSPELRIKLDAATPRPGDFVLYCRACEWVGAANAAHARSSTCPACGDHNVRIWKYTRRTT